MTKPTSLSGYLRAAADITSGEWRRHFLEQAHAQGAADRRAWRAMSAVERAAFSLDHAVKRVREDETMFQSAIELAAEDNARWGELLARRRAMLAESLRWLGTKAVAYRAALEASLTPPPSDLGKRVA